MNAMVLLVETLILLAAFTLMTALPLTLNPIRYVPDYPPEIQAEMVSSERRAYGRSIGSRFRHMRKLDDDMDVLNTVNIVKGGVKK